MTSSSSLDRTLILSVTLPGGSRQEVFVQRGLTIGRTDANTVCIDHPDVERIHARVSVQPDGSLLLECQSDKSGLLVDGDSLPKFRLPLTPGTQFRIGPARLECTLWQSLAKERWVASPWRVRRPRCHASLADEPHTAKICPQCSLAIFYFNPATDSERQEAGGFTGWLPAQVGPYEIRSFVAEGGMGIVLRGLHRTTDKFAAVKLLQLSDDPQAEARFTEEVANVARCVHPNIVRLQESGHDGRLVWLALDWVDGKPLESYIAKAKASDTAISIEKIVDWMAQIVKGLSYLHQQGIIHRDLKPGNILVGQDGLVKITDFSIAKDPKSGATSMTRTGTVAGSAGYMSHEQQDGRHVGLETDIFSLGVVWYELLMLRRPVGTYQSIRTKHLDCPPEWDDLVARCLEFDPKRRPTVKDILKSLASEPEGDHGQRPLNPNSSTPVPSRSPPPSTVPHPDWQPVQALEPFALSLRRITWAMTAGLLIAIAGLVINFALMGLGDYKHPMAYSESASVNFGTLLAYSAASLWALSCIRRGIWVRPCTALLATDLLAVLSTLWLGTLPRGPHPHWAGQVAIPCIIAAFTVPLAAHMTRIRTCGTLRWLPISAIVLILMCSAVCSILLIFDVTDANWWKAVLLLFVMTVFAVVAALFLRPTVQPLSWLLTMILMISAATILFSSAVGNQELLIAALLPAGLSLVTLLAFSYLRRVRSSQQS